MNRREFIRRVGGATAVAASGAFSLVAAEPAKPTAQHLPRWRGFNLLEKFTKRAGGNPPFLESDFVMMAEWGFDFARLPMSYLCWSDSSDWLKLREEELKHIDGAVELGRQHHVHINLNLHRAPGYCVNPPKEPLDLWSDEKALEACAFHWAHFARRYKGIPNGRVSFDLLNEPADIPEETYARVVKRLVEAIRAEDPQRLIIADGLRWGTAPVGTLAEMGIGQSTRGYEPMQISHYKANWIHGSDTWPEPTWPLKKDQKEIANKETLRQTRIQPWKKLEAKGVGIHVGEWGAFNRTPHQVALAWMRDCLDLWKEAGWGWAVWNLRGGFGVLDSERQDVRYEDHRGHKLDRAMLEVLRAG
ncbi:MAG TPA: cellulase family glycosylhydrolase [Candidatus Limnocylindrales bacterium]|jgi:endoglucanase|nr:cellulase family glycosylhydrolase [Candidatus Limnocylindrales bacterium]